MTFTSQASCIHCDYPHARTNADRVCKLCYEQIQEDTMIEEGFYRPHITTVSTPSSMTGDALQGDNCSECHATYGHRISCSTLFRGSAACRFTDTDTILAHGLGVDLTK